MVNYFLILFVSDIDCHKVFVKYFEHLLEAVTFPSSLANGLRTAGLVSQQVVDHVHEAKGTTNEESMTKMLKEVRKWLHVTKGSPQQREMMMKFCQVLRNQDNPLLTHLAERMLSDSGTLSVDTTVLSILIIPVLYLYCTCLVSILFTFILISSLQI